MEEVLAFTVHNDQVSTTETCRKQAWKRAPNIGEPVSYIYWLWFVMTLGFSPCQGRGALALGGAWQHSCWPESSSQPPAKGLAGISIFPSACGLQMVIGIWLKVFSAPAARKCEDVFLFLLLTKHPRNSGNHRCGALTDFWSSSFSCFLLFFFQYFWILPLLQ